jgi:hypothetical protein
MAKPPRKPRIVAFTFPPDAPITPLPISEWRGVCTECESNRPVAEVRGAEGTAPRRLCIECLTKEFTPPSPSEGPAPSFSPPEAEEGWPRMSAVASAKWADVQWAMHEGPMSPELAAAIEHAEGSGVPLAVPQANAVVEPADIRAATLALVNLRGAVCDREFVAPDRFIIEPDPEVKSRAQAAELLARLPKPIDCAARAIDGAIHVRCRPLAGETLWTRAMSREPGGYDPYADQQERFGAKLDEQKEFCLGCQESLVVTIAEVERFRRDYGLVPQSSSVDRPSSYLGTDPVAARAAMVAGAIRMMKCFFGSDDRSDLDAGRTIVVHGPPDWKVISVYSESPSSNATCEKCRARPATWLATDTRGESWLDRQLCPHCTAEELSPRAIADAKGLEGWVASLSEKGKRTAADRIASSVDMLEQWWQHLPIPPDVQAALERCRALVRGSDGLRA